MSTIDLSPAIRNLVIEQGQSVEVQWAVTQAAAPMNLAGYDARLQVRRNVSDSTTLLNCTLANGKLAWISQAAGTFKLVLTPTDTTSLLFKAGEEAIEAVYDLELLSAGGVVYKVCKGTFTINREVTR